MTFLPQQILASAIAANSTIRDAEARRGRVRGAARLLCVVQVCQIGLGKAEQTPSPRSSAMPPARAGIVRALPSNTDFASAARPRPSRSRPRVISAVPARSQSPRRSNAAIAPRSARSAAACRPRGAASARPRRSSAQCAYRAVDGPLPYAARPSAAAGRALPAMRVRRARTQHISNVSAAGGAAMAKRRARRQPRESSSTTDRSASSGADANRQRRVVQGAQARTARIRAAELARIW